MKRIPMALVRGYQRVLSPYLGRQCRFYPTCSHYALEALDRHGSIKGGALALGRVLRCHPWCEGCVDTVPKAWSLRWAWRRHEGIE